VSLNQGTFHDALGNCKILEDNCARCSKPHENPRSLEHSKPVRPLCRLTISLYSSSGYGELKVKCFERTKTATTFYVSYKSLGVSQLGRYREIVFIYRIGARTSNLLSSSCYQSLIPAMLPRLILGEDTLCFIWSTKYKLTQHWLHSMQAVSLHL
jgi:hypothetical protein